jgi:sporulation protein YlmC with PRC-barrel domain
MRRVLIATIFAAAASYAAYAQDAAPKPDANAPHPPENRMDQATPTMKAPEGQPQAAPTNRVGEAVPPMKSTDKEQSAGTGTQTPGAASLTVTEDEAKTWIGRAVLSSDGKKIGDVADLKRDPDNKLTELYADIGGFLGLGATRTLVRADQIQEVKSDGIVLKLSEAEAKSLPAADQK